MTPRRLARLLGLWVGAYALALRPRLLRWGATDEEVRRPQPGAELVSGGERGTTMAVTIDSPPHNVWPWLAQMGCDHAGWYSWDRLDNGGVPSAERIHPEWQEISVGDRLASTPSGSSWFEVAALKPERLRGLRASLDLRGRPFDPAGPHPRRYSDSIWSFVLDELPPGRTRLVVGTAASARPSALVAVANFIFGEPAHWIMQTRQFRNLRRRAEGDLGQQAAASGTDSR